MTYLIFMIPAIFCDMCNSNFGISGSFIPQISSLRSLSFLSSNLVLHRSAVISEKYGCILIVGFRYFGTSNYLLSSWETGRVGDDTVISMDLKIHVGRGSGCCDLNAQLSDQNRMKSDTVVLPFF